MKYAHEVIDLLAAYPGRPFKMGQILRHVAPRADRRRLTVVRVGVWRVIQTLEECGRVHIERPSDKTGTSSTYAWVHHA